MEGSIQWNLFIIELINTTLFSCGYKFMLNDQMCCKCQMIKTEFMRSF